MRPLRLLLLIILFSALSPPAEARDKVESIRRALVAARDAKERLAQVPKLVVVGGERAVSLLGWLIEHDPALHVRVGAARGLGAVRDEHAAAVLVERVQHGGPWALRRAMHEALARHDNAPRKLLRCLDDDGRPLPARLLILRALGALKDEGTRERLLYYAVSGDYALREAALRSLAIRKDDPEARRAAFAGWLDGTRDEEYVRELLDVLEDTLGTAMRSDLTRLKDHDAPDIADAADLLLERMPTRDPRPPRADPAPGTTPDERYAKLDPPTPPTSDIPRTPPADPRRQDLVILFDATGSAHNLLRVVHERTLQEIETRRAAGASLRLGVVIYRGGSGRRSRVKAIEVLPLTYDVDRALAFIEAAEACGTDDRGAAMAEGLREGLDRMCWRWKAVRYLRVFADSGCDDVRTTLPRVKTHFAADRTRSAFWYYLRTRGGIPSELDDLAKAGGTRQAFPIEREWQR